MLAQPIAPSQCAVVQEQYASAEEWTQECGATIAAVLAVFHQEEPDLDLPKPKSDTPLLWGKGPTA